MKCGIIEKRKGKTLPPCKRELREDKRPTYQCPVHCRSRKRVCGSCDRRYLKSEGEAEKCPNCGYQRRCSNHHVKGKRGCRMHGGTKKVGLASPNRKTLKYSRYVNVLGPEAKKKFQEVMRQSDALSLMPDIFMVDLEIEGLASRITQESAADWRDALKYFDQFAVSSEAKNKRGQVEALTMLGGVLRRGSERVRDTEGLTSLQTHRMKMISAERRNRLEHSVHKGLVFQLIDMIAMSLERHVKDDKAREAVGTDIARYTGAAVVTANQADDDAEDLGSIG